MYIYTVQPGDNIHSIAAKFGVPVDKLIRDNELEAPEKLIPGQAIVIVYPLQTHTVQEGESLEEIAAFYGTTIMKLIQYNPFLIDQELLQPGDLLTISYRTYKKLITNGFAYPFINRNVLLKTLPNLTYLSIYNYRADAEGNVTAFFDDTEIIQLCREHEVIPLMLISTLSSQGEISEETAYSIILNEQSQERQISNILNILHSKGYYGINVTFNYVNAANVKYYVNFITRISERLKAEGYYVLVTINPHKTNGLFEKLDYSGFAKVTDNIIFMHYIWGTNLNPPAPVTDISNIRDTINYVVNTVAPNKITAGCPIIGYDWELPYIPGHTVAHSLTLHAALGLARDTNSIIRFDTNSQTPFFYYQQLGIGIPMQHLVWFVNSKSVDALLNIVDDYGLAGTGVWNIMIFYTQLWLLINSQYEIEKLI